MNQSRYVVTVRRHLHGTKTFKRGFDSLSILAKYLYEILYKNKKLSISSVNLTRKERMIVLTKINALWHKENPKAM